MGLSLRQLVTECCQRQILIGVCRSGQREGRFSAGYVESVEAEGFTLRFVDPNGFPGDGGNKTSWYEFNELNWIDAGTNYLRGLCVQADAFWTYADAKKSEWITDRRTIDRELRGCCGALEACRVRFFEEEAPYWVVVRSIDGDDVALTFLSDAGKPDGERMIRRLRVVAIRARGVDELAMTHLVRNQELVPKFEPIIGA